MSPLVQEMPIDLRSDTVTRPSAAMRRAMAEAEVGDDVIDIDPTVQRLEQTIAAMLGKERALFMPSGSMTNQIAVRIHCKPGDEFLCEEDCHIYNYEQGAFAQLSGVVARTISGDHGVLRLPHLEGKVRPINEHMVRTKMLALENTHNRASGRVQPLEAIDEVTAWARSHGLATHLDGARLFNAVVATGIPADRWARDFDTISVCFSKGLGAPVGSALIGSAPLIREARHHRKAFGGGMRQSGIIAAGALFALQHNLPLLAKDHQKARRLAETIQSIPRLSLPVPSIDSNIVIFTLDPSLGTAPGFVDRLASKQVRAMATGPQSIRFVTHLDVDMPQIERTCAILRELAEE